MDVATRAYRILRGIKHYHQADEIASTQLNRPRLHGSEVCIGVYDNSMGALDDCVFITNEGLYIVSKSTNQRIAFGELAGIQRPVDKYHAETILLTMKDGSTIPLKIKGGSGRFRDAWEFLRFLDRVLADEQRSS